jgi:hypothetical protein
MTDIGPFGARCLDNAKRRDLPATPVERDVNFNSINEPSSGFPPYFPRISPLRWRAIRENLPGMNLGQSKRQKTAKRSHELRQAVAVRDNSWGLSDRVLLEPTQASNEACTVDVRDDEKVFTVRFTVKTARLGR